MNPVFPFLCGALLGMAAGALLVPLTGRQLATSVARAASGPGDAADIASTAPAATVVTVPPPGRLGGIRIERRPWIALSITSGLLPALVVQRVGWSVVALPPLVLLVGLIQLSYCDLTYRLLPKTLVWALTVTVIGGELAVAAGTHEWARLWTAVFGGVALFALFFVINLLNPRWLAFGDVRLSLVVGFGLAWIGPLALLEGFFFANLLAAVVGLGLMAAHRIHRGSALPFGLYLTLGTALVLLSWS